MPFLRLNRAFLAIIGLSLAVAGIPALAAGAQRSDFNGDNKSDILWRHSSGAVTIWLMDGTQIIGGGQVATVDLDWQIVGVGDFNVDGRTDILWRNSTGSLTIWLMNGTSVIGGGILTHNAGDPAGVTPNVLTVGTGDYNGDGRADILLQTTLPGTPVYKVLSAWLMQDGIRTSFRFDVGIGGGPQPWGWQGVGSGDYNADGRSDILWRHSSGELAIWFMDGGHVVGGSGVIGGGGVGSVDVAWQVIGWGDYNADGHADILWRHTSGAVALWWMNGTSTVSGFGFGTVDLAWQIVGTGDYDGDGRADILWRHSSGAVAIWLMDGTQAIGGGQFAVVDPAWQIVNTP